MTGRKRDLVFQRIRQQILSGRYPAGSKLPREIDFAAENGVSFITMRAAMKQLVDEGLVLRIPGRGTFVQDLSERQALRPKRRILILIPDYSGDVANDKIFNRDFVLGAVKAAYPAWIEIEVRRNGADTRELPQQFRDGALLGVIWDRPQHEDFDTIEELHREGVPQVSLNRDLPGVPTIGCNYISAVRQAVHYLRNIGHRQIVLVDFALEKNSPNVFIERQKAFIELLRYDNVKEPEHHVIPARKQGWVAIAQAMRQLPEVTAALVSSTFIDAFQTYLDLEGIAVPRDLSVIQWGEVLNFDRSSKYPYTILTEPRQEAGARAVEMIRELSSGSSVSPEPLLLDGELIVRRGCSLPRTLRAETAGV